MPCTRLAAVALAMVTVGAVGCGGSGAKATKPSGSGTSMASSGPTSTVAKQSSSTPGKPQANQAPTRAAFIANADAICRRLNKEAATLITTSLHTVGTTATPLAGYYRAALAELHTLAPPRELAGTWNSMIADLQQVPASLATMGRFALDNDMKATVNAELKVQKLQQHRTAIARRHGFTDCGEV